MRKLILFLILFNSVNLIAQVEWAPLGAKWYFNLPSSTSGDYVAFESKKDSTIQCKNVRIIDVRLNGTTLVSQEYIYQNGDSVFYYNSNYNSFFLLYNFSAKAGDTITVHSSKFKPTKAFFSYYDSIIDFKYKIISIDSILISGKWLRRQKVENIHNSLWGLTEPTGGDNDYIIDKIGSITYFFGVSPMIYPEQNLSILRCYSESGFVYKNPLWTQDCDGFSAIQENKIFDNDIIYPNPFTNQLNIKIGEPIETIEIFDINGLKLLTVQQEKESVVLNTSFLNNGCYFLRITTKRHNYFKKIIKINPL